MFTKYPIHPTPSQLEEITRSRSLCLRLSRGLSYALALALLVTALLLSFAVFENFVLSITGSMASLFFLIATAYVNFRYATLRAYAPSSVYLAISLRGETVTDVVEYVNRKYLSLDPYKIQTEVYDITTTKTSYLVVVDSKTREIISLTEKSIQA